GSALDIFRFLQNRLSKAARLLAPPLAHDRRCSAREIVGDPHGRAAKPGLDCRRIGGDLLGPDFGGEIGAIAVETGEGVFGRVATVTRKTGYVVTRFMSTPWPRFAAANLAPPEHHHLVEADGLLGAHAV